MSSESATEHEGEVLAAINITLGTLSLLGSTFIITCYYRYRDIRNFGFQLVLYMAMADFVFDISNMMGDRGSDKPSPSPACTAQAILQSFFNLASILWAGTIAFTLHMGFLLKLPEFSREKMPNHLWKFHVFCWGIPLLLTFLPFSTDSYGDAGGWCWITDTSSVSTAWRYIQFYMWLLLIVAYSVYVYYNVRRQMLAQETDAASLERKKVISRIKYYPLVLIIHYTPAIISRLYQSFSGKYSFGLAVWHALGAASYGLGNAFAYGTTDQIVAQIQQDCACMGHQELREDQPQTAGTTSSAEVAETPRDDEERVV